MDTIPTNNPQYVIQVKPQYNADDQMVLNATVFDKDETVVGQFAHTEVGKVLADTDILSALQNHGVSQDVINKAINNALKSVLDPKFDYKLNDSTTLHFEVDADRNPGVKVGFTIKF